MASSTATTVAEYLESLPAERRAVVARVREVVRASMPAGYEEVLEWGMISWNIPLSRYPDTYNGRPLSYVCLAAQKNHCALYMMGLYADPAATAAFARDVAAAGKKLDMGKSCVRFHAVDDLPLDVVAAAVARVTPEQYIAMYERTRAATKTGMRKASAKQSRAKVATTKKSAKKTTAKKSAAKKKAAGTRARSGRA